MFDKQLKELEIISQAAGSHVDYVQGGGGNTSVKLNEELMAVKASGYKLNQITATDGYVVVNYRNIKDYYNNVDLSSGTDYEKGSTEFAKNSVVEIEGLKKLRPSVEAGFHSILKKYVIHSHSVYANLLCCSIKGKGLVGEIFANKDYACIWIPYINPGFSLTLKIKEEADRCIQESGKFPEVVFMENHGLIVSTDDCQKTIDLHTEINKSIKAYLGIAGQFPDITLNKLGENTYRSDTEYLNGYFKVNEIGMDFFEKIVLYPDQLVYLNGGVSVDGPENKLNINTAAGERIYKSSFQEALTIEETLLAYLYVIDAINKHGLGLKTMPAEGSDFINNWESEKYRKSLVK